VRAGGGGVGVRGRHGWTGKAMVGVSSAEIHVSPTPSRGGDGAEKRTPGFPVGSESEEGQGGSGLVYVSWSVWARGDARWALLCWSRTV